MKVKKPINKKKSLPKFVLTELNIIYIKGSQLGPIRTVHRKFYEIRTKKIFNGDHGTIVR